MITKKTTKHAKSNNNGTNSIWLDSGQFFLLFHETLNTEYASMEPKFVINSLILVFLNNGHIRGIHGFILMDKLVHFRHVYS